MPNPRLVHSQSIVVRTAPRVLCLVVLLNVLWAGAAVSPTTLGVLVPIHGNGESGSRTVGTAFQKIGAAILLAIHHVNTRDGQIVGDAVNKLPSNFALDFRIADTYYNSEIAVKALKDWIFNDCTCKVLVEASNSSAPPVVHHAYEASPHFQGVGIDAVVGAFSSEVSESTSILASLKDLVCAHVCIHSSSFRRETDREREREKEDNNSSVH
jgi:hypothetical protein